MGVPPARQERGGAVHRKAEGRPRTGCTWECPATRRGAVAGAPHGRQAGERRGPGGNRRTGPGSVSSARAAAIPGRRRDDRRRDRQHRTPGEPDGQEGRRTGELPLMARTFAEVRRWSRLGSELFLKAADLDGTGLGVPQRLLQHHRRDLAQPVPLTGLLRLGEQRPRQDRRGRERLPDRPGPLPRRDRVVVHHPRAPERPGRRTALPRRRVETEGVPKPHDPDAGTGHRQPGADQPDPAPPERSGDAPRRTCRIRLRHRRQRRCTANESR